MKKQRVPIHKYFIRSIIPATFDFLRNRMCYFDHLCIKLYTSKNYKRLIVHYKSMQLDDLNKIPHDYIFSYTLAAIYKIS